MTPEFKFDWLKEWARFSPTAIALKDGNTGQQWSYQNLYELSQSTAALLETQLGIKKGDRVAVLSKNHWRYVVLYFALQRLGAILVPLNFRLAAQEIEYVLKDSAAKVFIYAHEFDSTVHEIQSRLESLKTYHFDGPNSFSTDMDQTPKVPKDFVTLNPEDPNMILYTSGTTGRPKGALITYKMQFWNSVNTSLRLNLTQHDVQLSFLPFFHTGGWNVLLTPFLHRGAKTILLDKFEPETILKLSEQEKVTILFGVPTMMDMMAQQPQFESTDLSSVRYAIVGGEPMPIPLIEKWQKKGIPIRQGYGLTEFGPNVFSLNEEDAIRKKGSIGFPNFYIETKVVNRQGHTAEVEEVGELLLKGPACTPGYWNNEVATKETIQDGWLHTGDLVKHDKDGYFYVVGRKKDMFISGGENVYPAEVEQILRSHPKIHDAAVIGVPDARWGEVGKAFLLLKPGCEVQDSEVLHFCLERQAKFKIPKYFRVVDALPKGDSGKILKRVLKEWD